MPKDSLFLHIFLHLSPLHRTKNVPWHILAPASVACDIYLIRRSVHPCGAFLLYRNAISCEAKKTPESHLWIQGFFIRICN